MRIVRMDARVDARAIVSPGPGFSLTFLKKLLETWARVSVRKIVDMDLENKISALKDFASFGSSSKGGPSSTRSNQSPQSTNSFSAQNGWGNWFAKGEKDPFLPSLVSVYQFMGRIRAFLSYVLNLLRLKYVSVLFRFFYEEYWK